LGRKPRATPSVPRIFDGEKEAKLIALACSKPPKGRARWTLRLLENKVVELNIVDRASDSTIWRTLKKTSFKILDGLPKSATVEQQPTTPLDGMQRGMQEAARLTGKQPVPLDESLVAFASPSFDLDESEMQRGEEMAKSLLSRGYGESSRHRSDNAASFAGSAAPTLSESYNRFPADQEKAGREMAEHLKAMAGGLR